MINDIFQVDWVFFDTIIIIILFLLLIGVKVFKTTHRWRISISNNNLEFYSLSNIPVNLENQFLRIVKWNLTKNSIFSKQNKKTPIILILRTNFKGRLIKVLTEGLSSYGFTVIHAKIKIRRNSFPNQENDIVKKGIKPIISSALDYLKDKGLIATSSRIIINFAKSLISPKVILSETDNIGLITINPKIHKENIGHFKELIINSVQYAQHFYLFNKRSFLFLKNRNFSRLFKEIKDKNKHKERLIILHKSNSIFKYYETILLGVLIDIIETKLMKIKI
ncbi:MAG: hypothetical protein ACFFFB_24120 [Candidatus Heimdallarchaeota archaeon]